MYSVKLPLTNRTLGTWTPDNIKELEQLRDRALAEGNQFAKLHTGIELRDTWAMTLLRTKTQEEFIEKANEICNGNLCAVVVKQKLVEGNFPIRTIQLVEQIYFDKE